MTHQPKRGKYIVIEGPHRSGKTIQHALLVGALRSRGLIVRQTQEPTMGGWARTYVQQQEHSDPRVTAQLMYADRRKLLIETVQPALARGEWVVQSRNFLSTYVLQGTLGGIDWSELDLLHGFAMRDLVQPDLIVILDPGSPAVLEERSTQELLDGDKLEDSITRDKHEKLIQAYRRFQITHSAWPIRSVRADLSVEAVRQLVRNEVNMLAEGA